MSIAQVAIIGGGAGGLAAGIFAAEAGAQVIILDGARSLGAKILVSGGGRCNVTHDVVRPDDFNANRPIVRNILAGFDERATVRWFESLGVKLKREQTGKLFPTSDRARSVLEALVGRCDQLGVSILADHRVADVTTEDSIFTICHSHGQLAARRVILATGGRSLPKSGSDGQGYDLARRLGHTVTPTYPALVPLVLEKDFFHAGLSGLSQEVQLTTLADATVVDRREGSMLWTHFGISGPVVMDASRHWVMARAAGRRCELRCSFVGGKPAEEIDQRLMANFARRPRAAAVGAMAGMMPQRIADALVRHAGIDPTSPAGQVLREKRRCLAESLAGLTLPVIADRGWNYAEVTAGGVPLAEIDYRTMQSRKTGGLYLIGEILDCDGRIGGFNFQWAWSTGYQAGRAAARA